jgi:hypothetical protein
LLFLFSYFLVFGVKLPEASAAVMVNDNLVNQTSCTTSKSVWTPIDNSLQGNSSLLLTSTPESTTLTKQAQPEDVIYGILIATIVVEIVLVVLVERKRKKARLGTENDLMRWFCSRIFL